MLLENWANNNTEIDLFIGCALCSYRDFQPIYCHEGLKCAQSDCDNYCASVYSSRATEWITRAEMRRNTATEYREQNDKQQ